MNSILHYVKHPKALGKQIVGRILERQVSQLRARYSFKVVAIVGSVGKTSTKMAIAETLAASQRVLWEKGNYNDRLTVPLVLFGQTLPSLLNVVAWCKVWLRNRRVIKTGFPYDIAVLELGTDGPGQIAEFAYLRPDIVVVTALTPEHMAYFKTLDAVAAEELSALNFSKQALINIDDSPASYLTGMEYAGYGLQPAATYHGSEQVEQGLSGQRLRMYLGTDHDFEVRIPMLGAQGAKMAVAAAATAHLLGIPHEDIERGLQGIEAFSGRMQILHGLQGSTLIDDTYNASPIAVKAALDVLYQTDAPQRIAILGSMNELGDFSAEAHREVGEYCDPKKLDFIVTIGAEANEFLAPVARQKGCQVEMFTSPYQAGEFVREHLKPKALILGKGSQNGVFAEEALKMLLANKEDAAKLVRQSATWLAIKAKQFAHTPTETQ